MRKITKFIKDMAIAAKNKVVGFVRGLYHHTEAAIIEILAALGLNALLGELPFLFTLPMWVEAPMVIPVVSVLIVVGLVKSAEWRHNHRAVATLAVA